MRSTLLVLLLIGILRTSAGLAAENAPAYPDHSNLLIYIDAQGRRQPVKTPADWAIRRQHILLGMQEAMGPLPDRSKLPPLDVQIKDEQQGDGYTRLSITLLTEGQDRLPAHLYLPAGMAKGERRPGIVALHGTSPLGKLVVAGEGPRANRGYAKELAQRGYVVIAPDYPPFGDYKYDFEADQYVSGTMKGIFNHMRCVDLLQERPEVAADRIAAIGHSLGGHNAIFLGVFDERVKVIVSSCGWTPFHDYYGGKIAGWTSDRYMPLLKTKYHLDPDQVPFDFYELVAALAPRAFFSNSPLKDSNFDVAGVRKGVEKARAIYELLGSPEMLQVRYPDAEHDFPLEVRREAFEFIDRLFGHKAAMQVP